MKVFYYSDPTERHSRFCKITFVNDKENRIAYIEYYANESKMYRLERGQSDDKETAERLALRFFDQYRPKRKGKHRSKYSKVEIE